MEGEGDYVRAVDDIRFVATNGETRIYYSADIIFTGLVDKAAPRLGGILNRVGKKAMAGLRKALSQEPSAIKRKFVTHFAGHDRPWQRYSSLPGAHHAASSRLARYTTLSHRKSHRDIAPLHLK